MIGKKKFPIPDVFLPGRIDKKAAPPMFKISETHLAATWRLHPDAPKVELPEELRHRIERARKEAEQYL